MKSSTNNDLRLLPANETFYKGKLITFKTHNLNDIFIDNLVVVKLLFS